MANEAREPNKREWEIADKVGIKFHKEGGPLKTDIARALARYGDERFNEGRIDVLDTIKGAVEAEIRKGGVSGCPVSGG